MKITDILFWGALLAIAVFYIVKGNDMHREKMEKIEQVFSQDKVKETTTVK